MENRIVLGTICVINGVQKIDFLQSIKHFEYQKLEKEISILEVYKTNVELYSIFLINFLELSQYFQVSIDELVSKQIYILNDQREEFQIIYRNSNRLLLNLLSSARTLIDHYETYFKKKYGKESNEVTMFKAVMNKIYDENFEYRFVYKLRNYSQHCGLPINSIKYSFENVTDENLFSSIANLNPMFIREHLLTKYKEWGKLLTDELKTKTDEFPVMPIIYEYCNCISQIIEEFKNIEKKSMKESILEIKKTTDLFTNYDESYQLCVFYNFIYSNPNSYENSKFDVLTIPMNLINEINIELEN